MMNGYHPSYTPELTSRHNGRTNGRPGFGCTSAQRHSSIETPLIYRNGGVTGSVGHFGGSPGSTNTSRYCLRAGGHHQSITSELSASAGDTGSQYSSQYLSPEDAYLAPLSVYSRTNGHVTHGMDSNNSKKSTETLTLTPSVAHRQIKVRVHRTDSTQSQTSVI